MIGSLRRCSMVLQGAPCAVSVARFAFAVQNFQLVVVLGRGQEHTYT